MADPRIVENTTYITRYQEHIEAFKAKAPEYTNFVDADFIMLALSVAAASKVEDLEFINVGTRQNFLSTATGEFLDLIGEIKNVTRLVLVEADPTANPPVAQVLETDDAFRQRIKEAVPDNASTAEKYEFLTKGYSADIESALAFKPNKNSNTVNIAIKTVSNNGIASPEFLAEVQEYMSARSRRAIGDDIVVVNATAIPVNVTGTITLLTGSPSTAFDDLPTILGTAIEQINDLGRNVTVSWLTKILNTDDVYSVELTAPTEDVIVGEREFAILGTVDLTLESEGDF